MKNQTLILANNMTLRDYFAAQALLGLLAEGKCGSGDEVAHLSYFLADEMLKKREE